MKTLSVIIVVVLALVISGCATTKRSSLAFKKDSGGSLSVWSAEMSAAVAYKDGDICMQRALVARTTSVEADAKVSEAVAALVSAKAALTEKGSGGDLASLNMTINQALSLLTTTTERTAFLDIGMFYICQLSSNGSISPLQVAELLKELMRSASSVGMFPASAVSFDEGQ